MKATDTVLPSISAIRNVTQWYTGIKNYHRHILWVILACLFALDIITTTVSLNLGHPEQNPLLIPFADDPILHGIIKIGVFFLLFLVIERAVSFIQEKHPESQPFWIRVSYRTLYGLIIFVLLYLIWIYSFVVISNIAVLHS
jgi:hypothetical protein